MGNIPSCITNQADSPLREFLVTYGNQTRIFTMVQTEVTLERIVQRCITKLGLPGSPRNYEIKTEVIKAGTVKLVVLADDESVQSAMNIAAHTDWVVSIILEDRTWGATDDKLLMQTTEPVKKHNRLASKTPGIH